MSKNIVIFSDGTGQEGGKGNNTNVYKLFNMIEDRTPHQVAFYDRGLGTGFRRLSGSAFGVGISRNVRECYEFLFENYQAGDKVFLFGFSRGAFTIRSLSGFVNLIRILPKSRHELIKQAYKIYKINDKVKRKVIAEEFLSRHHTMRCPIEFIGVWDTVGALGVPFRPLDFINPFRHDFHDTQLARNVVYGCHALAIDDQRRTFHPTLWDERDDFTKQRVEQVWFAGMHTDVGGGYEKHGLSDISLEWMIIKAARSGLRIYPRHKVDVRSNADGHMHDSRGGLLSGLYRRKVRELTARIKSPVIHQSVLDRTLDRHNEQGNGYSPWIMKHKNNSIVEPR